MAKLSLITTGRDDDYERHFVERMRMSLINNCDLLNYSGIDYEYIVVEWNPYREFLYNSDRTSDIFRDKRFNIKDVVVSESVVEKEVLDKSKYFEYFAKNTGIRKSTGDALLIINSDILMTKSMVETIGKLVNNYSGLDKNVFYRARYRHRMRSNESYPFDMTDLHNPSFADSCICGGYSGDFLLVHKDSFVNIGQGYDEVEPKHRKTFQTAMDAEVLWNMYHRGMSLAFLEDPYIHIEHGKHRVYDGHYNLDNTYINKPNWGFIDYETQTIVKDKLEVII